MLRVYFGDVTTGRVSRLPYVGYFLLLIAGFLVLGFVLATATRGIGGFLGGGDPVKAAEALDSGWGYPFAIIAVVAAVAMIFACLNLTAKRFRDMGVSGWTATIIVVVVTWIVAELISETASAIVQLLALLALLATPSDGHEGG